MYPYHVLPGYRITSGLSHEPLHPRCCPACVELLQKSLGAAYEFNSVFPIILTDRGGEFGSPERLETNPDGIQRTSIYYYGPMRGNQKGGIENVHTMLRMILPKGTVLRLPLRHPLCKQPERCYHPRASHSLLPIWKMK